jgi:hypothetical protein
MYQESGFFCFSEIFSLDSLLKIAEELLKNFEETFKFIKLALS